MNFFIPFIGSLLSSGAAITDKVLLGGKGITYKNYSVVSFLAALFVAGIAFFAFGTQITLDLFKGYAGLLLIFTTATILTSNLLYYHALKNDLLTEMETVTLLANVPIIIAAFIFFPDENKNLLILYAALIASLAVIWSHWEKGHPFVKRKTWPFLIWVLIIAPIEAAAFKQILTIWHPISLQFVREIIIVPFLGFMYADTLKKVSPRSFVTIFFTGSILTLGSILFFISYSKFGIIQTTLIFTLQPLLTYIGGLVLLKEKFHKKKIIAFLIVLIVITIAQIPDILQTLDSFFNIILLNS